MKNIQYSIIVSVVALLGAMTAAAADFVVIANPSVTVSSISVDELKNVFLEKQTSFGGGSVQPVLSSGGSVHEAFLTKFLGKTDSALQAYYRSLLFAGTGAIPKTLASDADIVAFVAKTKGAIGYVAAGASTTGVKTLEVK